MQKREKEKSFKEYERQTDRQTHRQRAPTSSARCFTSKEGEISTLGGLFTSPFLLLASYGHRVRTRRERREVSGREGTAWSLCQALLFSLKK